MGKYTDEQRAEALRIFQLEGATKAAQAIGCTRQVIYQWLKQAAEIDTPKTEEQITAEAEADSRYQNTLRLSLRRRLLALAHDVLDRIDQPHIDFKVTKEGVIEVGFPTARSGDVKNYVTSAAILLDKWRLEMGESTDRIDQTGGMAITINGVDVSELK